jgi:hypothetical protein
VSRSAATGILPWLAVFALSAAAPLAAQSGRFTLRGRVVEAGQDRGIAQATVQLGDSARVITDERGEFEIRRVRPGRYSLAVEALGYRTVRTTVVVTGDATGTIEMEPDPIPLDPLAVRPARFDLRGRLRARDGGYGVPYATVRLEAGGETSSNDAGHFKLGGLPRGRHIVVIEGYGWMPVRAAIELDSDTSVVFDLDVDPIMDRVIEQQIERLDERARGAGTRLRVVDRQEVLRSRAATAAEILGLHVIPCIPSGRMGCVFSTGRTPSEPYVWIDDQLTFCGLEVLNTYPVAAIQRIELVGGIRAYTVWHIERLAARRVGVPPFIPYERRFPC